ncbi:MAG: DUF6452 family protein [Bacteroidota bacterium]
MTKVDKYLCVALFCIACLATACTQERQPCLTPMRANLNVRTIQFKKGAAETVDTALPAAIFRAFTPSGVQGFIFDRASTFVLSLSPDSDTSKWAFTTDTSGTPFDTLTFYYRRDKQFISNACGYACFFKLDSVHTTRKIIDSIHIINANVTNNANAGNLQIYIHPGA